MFTNTKINSNMSKFNEEVEIIWYFFLKNFVQVDVPQIPESVFIRTVTISLAILLSNLKHVTKIV